MGTPNYILGGLGTATPEKTTCESCTLSTLIQMAYEVPANRISGPDWLTTVEYDVVAKVPAGSKDDQFRAMWQALVTERFGLHVHREPKEFAVYELMIGKDGAKLQETRFDTTNIYEVGTHSLTRTIGWWCREL